MEIPVRVFRNTDSAVQEKGNTDSDVRVEDNKDTDIRKAKVGGGVRFWVR